MTGETLWHIRQGISWEENYQVTSVKLEVPTTAESASDLSLEMDSVAIQRMIEEIRSGDPIATAANYNRTHNKHNR
jgi:hypothetical protein